MNVFMFGERYIFQVHLMINLELNFKKNISFLNGLNNSSFSLLERYNFLNLIVHFLYRKWQQKLVIFYKLIALIQKIVQKVSTNNKILRVHKK
jgi:hypothetical protein